ncbi:hypothetical protein ACFXJ8_42090, partial [Nonomuraea sp. NPDC059194]
MNPFLAVRLIAGQLQRWTYMFLTTPDPKTLQPSLDLAESWEFPVMLSNRIPIVPKHVWEKVGDMATYENETYPAVTNGAYIPIEHKKD